MSLIPHDFMPRSMLEMDNWMRPSLDLFDPFDDLDHMMSRNLHWLQRPQGLMENFLRPRVPEKYRITLDCSGYNPNSLKTEVKDGKLVITGLEEHGSPDSDDYVKREFRKTYKLPPNAEVDKLISFFAGRHLVVEVPLKLESENILQEELFPQIIDGPNGQKEVKLNCTVPQGIDPSKLSVTCKDRDLVIKAQDKVEREDGISQTFFYKHYRLPENTNLNALKCELKDHKLTVHAPMQAALKHHHHIPIEHKKSH